MNTHIETVHIEENPSDPSSRLQCSYCDSNCAQKNDLDTHIKQKHEENGNSGDKTHTSTRFQCSYCDCNYARKATLQKHEENCKSVGQFQCPYCECKFSKKPNLKMHIKQKHKENFENTNFKNIFRSHSKVHSKSHDEKPDDLPKELETEFEAESDLSGIDLKLGTFHCDLCMH